MSMTDLDSVRSQLVLTGWTISVKTDDNLTIGAIQSRMDGTWMLELYANRAGVSFYLAHNESGRPYVHRACGARNFLLVLSRAQEVLTCLPTR